MNVLTSIMGMMSQEGAAAAAAAGDAAAATAQPAATPSHSFALDSGGWMPESASVTSSGVDWLFYGVLILSVICFVGITAAVVYFTIKYRARPGHKVQPSPSHNDPLEITWTVIPAIICVFLFVFGWRSYIDIATPPPNALEIQVKGLKWKWEFTHYNGVKDDALHVPKGRSVRLVMTSNDVLHSFFVPAFRIKQDVLPKRYTQVWFQATEAGVYRLYCTEYCGRDHSQMKTTVVVHETEQEYKQYLQARYDEQMNMSPEDRGLMVYNNYCVACHTTDGTSRVGPTFKGLFGSRSKMSDGTEVVVDENHIRESILEPQLKIRENYPPSMTPFKGVLSDDDITGVIEYLKTIK
jgi:cytochrome c oxidase subunit 2